MAKDLRGLIPELMPYAQALVDAARRAGLQPRITSVRRSRLTQESLYRRWLNGTSPYPAAPPGTSKHEVGLAFDITLSDMRRLRDLGTAWESFGDGFVWGGRFHDPIHFDYRPELVR